MHALNVVPDDTQQLVELFGAMNVATKAADDCIASESNKTSAKFIEMMEAIQASMKGTAEEIHSLRERVAAGEHRNKELELLLQAEKKASVELLQEEKRASDAQISALNEKVTSLSMKLSELENDFVGHYHHTTTRMVVTARYPDGNPVAYGPEILTTGPEGIRKK